MCDNQWQVLHSVCKMEGVPGKLSEGFGAHLHWPLSLQWDEAGSSNWPPTGRGGSAGGHFHAGHCWGHHLLSSVQPPSVSSTIYRSWRSVIRRYSFIIEGTQVCFIQTSARDPLWSWQPRAERKTSPSTALWILTRRTRWFCSLRSLYTQKHHQGNSRHAFTSSLDRQLEKSRNISTSIKTIQKNPIRLDLSFDT